MATIEEVAAELHYCVAAGGDCMICASDQHLCYCASDDLIRAADSAFRQHSTEQIETRAKLQALEKAVSTGQLIKAPEDPRDLTPAVGGGARG